MVSRVVPRLVSRAIHSSPPPCIFRPLHCLPSFPTCPGGKAGALYAPYTTTVPLWRRAGTIPYEDLSIAGESRKKDGPFEYEESELVSSEDGLWDLYKRWQDHYGIYDSQEKRNSRRFSKFKRSAKYIYEENRATPPGMETLGLSCFSATYTPREFDRKVAKRTQRVRPRF